MGAVWEGVQRCGLEGSRLAGRPEKAPREFRWDAGLHLRAMEKRSPEKDAGAGGHGGNWYLKNWERHSS